MSHVVVLCTLAALVLTPSTMMAQGSALYARVASVSGNALVAVSGAPSGFSLTRGYELSPGDRIDTRSGARVVIDLSDGSMVVVQPGTVLTIKDYRAAESIRELFEITLGSVRVRIHHLTGKPNPYRMNSPTASIAVRGTEFNVVVQDDGDTRVDVIEGAVEVGRLDDPNDRALVEAGRGVLVRPGQNLQFTTAGVAEMAPPPVPRPGPDRDRRGPGGDPAPPVMQARGYAPRGGEPPPYGPGPRMAAAAGPGGSGNPAPVRNPSPAQSEAVAPVPTAAALIAAPDVPMLFRFNAFSDLHIDTYENPAYAAGAKELEARASVYGRSPQVSLLLPLPKGFVAGAGVAEAVGQGDALQISGSNATSFEVFAARRFGSRTSVGFSAERLRIAMTGSSEVNQSVAQTRFTAGTVMRLSRTFELGTYFRHGIADALSQVPGSIVMSPRRLDQIGQTNEGGVRVRAALTRRVSFGVAASVNTSDFSRYQSNVTSFSGGVGYAVTSHTIFSFDTSAGTIHAAQARTGFTSIHIAAQRDFTKHLFVTGSAVKTWRNEAVSIPLWRTHYIELGAGWRFTPLFSAQYLFVSDNLSLQPRHMVAVRYTFRNRGE